MAYDSARRVTVLFGGHFDSAPYVSGETWEWDGLNWTLRSTTGPAARFGAAMAYDARRKLTLMMGGNDASGHAFAEFWAWNGSTWVSRPFPPSSIGSPALAYDSARGVTVMVARGTSYQTYCETREWDGTNWSQPLAHGPEARSGHTMAYDVRRHVTVLHGGWWGVSDQEYYDTWEWDGARWLKRSTYYVCPETTCMAYDSARGVTVAFGGENYLNWPTGGTWDWDGNTWTQRMIREPIARARAAMAYDAARGEIVMFGGRNNPSGGPNQLPIDNTWTLGGGRPTMFAVPPPPTPMTPVANPD